MQWLVMLVHSAFFLLLSSFLFYIAIANLWFTISRYNVWLTVKYKKHEELEETPREKMFLKRMKRRFCCCLKVDNVAEDDLYIEEGEASWTEKDAIHRFEAIMFLRKVLDILIF